MVVPLLIYLTLKALTVECIYHESMTQHQPAVKLDENALFGYSVAFHEKRLFVSAPNISADGIYQCKYTESSTCDKIKINVGSHNSYTNAWLGATVATGKDFVMACAPRFIEVDNKTGTYGKCYSSKVADTFDFQRMFYLTKNDKEKNLSPSEKYMDSLGWSIDVDFQDNLMIGGPAMYTGRVAGYNPFTKRITHLHNGESTNIKFNFGYSVTSGFFIDTSEIHQAISSTYGTIGYGMVILGDGINWQKLQHPVEYKPKVGSLFGASLCAAKIRGPNQREALLIGAPLYAKANEVDVGAVYVYLYNQEMKYVVHEKTILNNVHKGQFGSAIISLGDLNGDKRDEVAIAAPYEDNDNGAVYIYSAADILNEMSTLLKPIQKINPKSFSMLGFSLAAFKVNGSGDLLAIGAPGSNKVLLYKSIPKIVVTVNYLTEHKTAKYPSARRNESYFVFDSCVNIQYPDRPKIIKADIEVQVSLTHKTARIATASDDGSLKYSISILNDKKTTYCKQVSIIIASEAGYEPDVSYSISATQLNKPSAQAHYEANHAQISDISTTSVTDTVWLADCEGYKKCEPKLTLDVLTTLKDDYVIGSTKVESFRVLVNNSGDVAYSACVGVRVRGAELRSQPAGCTYENDTLYCSPHQPIRNNSQWDSGAIELEMKSLTSDAKQITLTVRKFVNCKNKSQKDDEKMTSVFRLKTDPTGLNVMGSTSLGDEVFLTGAELEATGKQMSHNYIIFNGGVTEWVNISCQIAVQKRDYYKNITVTVDARESYECDEVTLSGQFLITKCTINKLRSQHKFDVILSINIEPGALNFDEEEQQNVTISSYIAVHYGENKREGSVTSLLKKKQASVPLWVIIAAALVGLLLMIIIILALHEIGFLRRKNKEKLQKLKRSVHRQSIRRSMALRESIRASVRVDPNKKPEDEEKLVNEEPQQEPSLTNLKPNDTDENSTSKDDSVANLECIPTKGENSSKGEEVNKIPLKRESDMVDPNKMRKELIILGLQKNIGARQRPIVPPKPLRNSINVTENNN